jgi:hypothetical protein
VSQEDELKGGKRGGGEEGEEERRRRGGEGVPGMMAGRAGAVLMGGC